MAKVYKRQVCDRLVCGVAYTAPAIGDSAKARAQKRKASTAARERLNARKSYQKLELALAANFDDGDLFVTLTFDDKHLPESRRQAISKARSFWAKLRAARGEPPKYIYVVEGLYPGGRPHIHAVLNSTGEDLELIRQLWTYGDNVEVRRLKFDRSYTYEDLASYLTKEPREWGHPHVGERTWIASLGLARPQVETMEIPDDLTLTAPPDALIVSKEGPISNGYGEWCWIKYLLPPTPGRRKPKARRRRRKKE